MKKEFVILFLILFVIVFSFFELPRNLIWGWLFFLHSTIPKMTIDQPALILSILAILLFVVLVNWSGNRLVNRLFKYKKSNDYQWKVKYSFYVSGLIFIMFGSGISTIGLLHQGIWLAASDKPRYKKKSLRINNDSIKYNLRSIGLGVLNSNDVYNSLPVGGTFTETGVGLHGWFSKIKNFVGSGYQERDDGIDYEKPWKGPANEKYFKCLIPELINPDLEDAPVFDSDGFGLSHFAANSHVIGPGQPYKLSEIMNKSNTLLIGEVNANFMPWGHPVNWRDPLLGINKSPYGFGGPKQRKGSMFIMADGSVKTVSENVDPAILKAMALPKR
jgi:hypothetical protein